MKITAFILSILLSITALAEDRAGQYSDVNVAQQLDYIIADDQIPVVEADDLVEWIDEAFDRGEITEEVRNNLLSNIDKLKAAHREVTNSEYSNECLKCYLNSMQLSRTQSGITTLFAVVGTVAGMWLPVGVATTVASAGILFVASFALPLAVGLAGAGLGSIVAEIADLGIEEGDCAKVCSSETMAQ